MPRQPSETVIAQMRFLYNISKNEHFNAKDIRPGEFLELQNNIILIPAMKPTQINEFQGA